MQIQKILTLDEIVAEETGTLMYRICALRVTLEEAKQEIARLKMELAKLAPEVPPA